MTNVDAFVAKTRQHVEGRDFICSFEDQKEPVAFVDSDAAPSSTSTLAPLEFPTALAHRNSHPAYDLATAIGYVIDEDPTICKAVAALLETVGIVTRAFRSAEEFPAAYEHRMPGGLLLEARLSGKSLLGMKRLCAEGVAGPFRHEEVGSFRRAIVRTCTNPTPHWSP